ncbi:MAG: hypothetical protein EXS16_09155 [Gemmataceae bacterium]|nr:hypothetical protein [Gemmataceae bacterium]
MMRVLLVISIVCSPVFFSIVGRAQEREQVAQPEKLPAPKVQIVPNYEIVPYLPRTGSRDVWQHYGVSPLGRFVPKVIVTSYGAMYSRDLAPYPWIQNRSTAIMPYARD